jgi:FkbM family methyltransferase
MSNNLKALNELDKKMLKYLNFKDGCFIELGANDGVNQSNTYFYEKELNWSGLLIEPTHKFNDLIKNRSKPNNFLENEACCSFENEGKEIEFSYCNLMTTCNDKNISDNCDPAAHVEGGKRFIPDEQVFNFTKKGVSLSSLLDKNKLPRTIDFFSLDTEGLESEILKGIDFSKYFFKYILIETPNFNKIDQILTHHNYKFVEQLSYHDFLFTNED